jgi:hypothetical protein
MARIRSLKPEIYQSSEVMDCKRDTRHLFIGCITQADDEGRGIVDPRKFKACVFPGDEDITSANVLGMFQELDKNKLIWLYTDSNHRLIYALREWKRHQRIDKPRASALEPPPRQGLVDDHSKNVRGSFVTDREDRSDGSIEGSEGRRAREKENSDPDRPRADLDPDAPKQPHTSQEQRADSTAESAINPELQAEWIQIMGAYPAWSFTEEHLRQGRAAYADLRDQGVMFAKILRHVQTYARQQAATGDRPFNPAKFFGSKHWEGPFDLPPVRETEAAARARRATEASWARVRKYAEDIACPLTPHERDGEVIESPDAFEFRVKNWETHDRPRARGGPKPIAAVIAGGKS